MDDLDLTADQDDLFDPIEPRTVQGMGSKQPKTPPNPAQTSRKPRTTDTTEADDAREAELRAELESIRRINGVIEGLISSLDRAKANMDTINQTVNNASSLLDTWLRILSQTEHNHRLILNPTWTGATQDIAEAESEILTRQREKERQEAEEAARREAHEEQLRRRAEEEERKKTQAAATTAGRGTRRTTGVTGTRGTARGTTTSTTARGNSTAASSSAPSARASGRSATAGYGRVGAIGTGKTPTARGRGRGVG